MEQFGNIIFYGFLIGVLVSAPMGPVGMLIIQRTLNKGRWPAFFTGIGAAFSDLVYCLITGFGMSFVGEFLDTNQCFIQIFGSLVIAAFAIYLFQRNPARALQKSNDRSKLTFFRDAITGFLFTFANPLIIFFIIGLFGRFNFLLPEYQSHHLAAGFLFIFVGALAWWFLITFFVNKMRSHFNVRAMWIINKAIGSILMIMAIVGIYHGIEGFIEKNTALDHTYINHDHEQPIDSNEKQSDKIFEEISSRNYPT